MHFNGIHRSKYPHSVLDGVTFETPCSALPPVLKPPGFPFFAAVQSQTPSRQLIHSYTMLGRPSSRLFVDAKKPLQRALKRLCLGNLAEA